MVDNNAMSALNVVKIDPNSASALAAALAKSSKGGGGVRREDYKEDRTLPRPRPSQEAWAGARRRPGRPRGQMLASPPWQ